MAGETLEKICIVPSPEGEGYRVVLAWMTGGSGRRAEILPELHDDEETAREAARVAYGMEPEAGDAATDRRP